MNKKKSNYEKDISSKIASLFGLSLSTRYYCPSPTHQSNSPSYSLENNYCFSCKHKGNDIVELVEGLQEANPRVFRDHTYSRSEIENLLAGNAVPTEFVRTKTKSEIEDDQAHRNQIISRLIDHKIKTDAIHGKFEINKVEYDFLMSELRLGNREFPTPAFPVTVYFQSLAKKKSIYLPVHDFQMGLDFMRGSFDPTSVVLTDSPEKVITTDIKDDQFICATPDWLPKAVQLGLETQTVTTVTVENEELFGLLLAYLVKNKLPMPRVFVNNPKSEINSGTAKKLATYFSVSDIEIPEGVNYLNLNKEKEFDDILEIGGIKLKMGEGILPQSKSLIKTGAINLVELFTAERRSVENNFLSDGSMVRYAIETLEAQPKTVNIEKEINLLKALSPQQTESLDIQLKVAKAIKEMFPNEFWGIKGSANNLNILYLMGITSVNPAEIEPMTPYSFLNPATNKNPDFDFELSGKQIEKFLEKYPEFTKGINETSKGDRIHVCKFFLNLEDDLKVYQTGKYIPIDSKEIEKTSATPIDLLSSNVVTRINDLSSTLGLNEIPEGYRVSRTSLEQDQLPHFNAAVVRQLPKKRRGQKEESFDTFELASMCSGNRPIFYRTKLVLKNEKGNKFYFSMSSKKGFENLSPLNEASKTLLESGAITEDDIINFDSKSDEFAGFVVDYCKPNYLVRPPQWAIANDEPLLEMTGGIIRYQEQLMMLLSKYSKLSAGEIKDIVDQIAHASKVDTEEFIDIDFNKGTPDAIVEQVNFIVKSPEAFFFKMGHAMFLAETARKLSYYERANLNALSEDNNETKAVSTTRNKTTYSR